MNPEELREKLCELDVQMALLDDKLDSAKETRAQLQKERFDLKEQRRYFRGQLREAAAAGNRERVDEIDVRLMEIEDQISDVEDKIAAMDEAIEEINDQMDDVMDAQDDLRELLEDADEGPDGDAGWEFKVDKTVEQVNEALRKVFKKAGDVIDRIDFEQVGEKAQAVADKAAKAAAGAARSVEGAWNDAKETYQGPLGVGDHRVSGSSTMDGGCYNRVIVSGSCKVNGDLVCRELRVAGSFKAAASVDCGGEVRASGSLKCAGPMKAGTMGVSGSLKTDCDLNVGDLTVSGVVKVGGAMKAGAVRSSGVLAVEHDLEAEVLESSGSLNVGGMVNAETVSIRLSLAESTVGAIGGSEVTVSKGKVSGALAGLIKPRFGRLTCESIEGDHVELCGVTAQVVRGVDVVIGDDCDIETVEYTGTCRVEGTGRAGKCQKV